MIPVKSEGSVSVNGLVGVGLQARSNRARQTFIVNGRTIRSQVLTQALEDGCRERVTIGHYPICVLNIDMPTNMVDVTYIRTSWKYVSATSIWFMKMCAAQLRTVFLCHR